MKYSQFVLLAVATCLSGGARVLAAPVGASFPTRSNHQPGGVVDNNNGSVRQVPDFDKASVASHRDIGGAVGLERRAIASTDRTSSPPPEEFDITDLHDDEPRHRPRRNSEPGQAGGSRSLPASHPSLTVPTSPTPIEDDIVNSHPSSETARMREREAQNRANAAFSSSTRPTSGSGWASIDSRTGTDTRLGHARVFSAPSISSTRSYGDYGRPQLRPRLSSTIPKTGPLTLPPARKPSSSPQKDGGPGHASS